MNFFRKKPEPPKPGASKTGPQPNLAQVMSMRETLFGDQVIEKWPANDNNVGLEPWKSFIQARQALNKGDKSTALARWRAVTTMPNLEPRHYIQAWTFLRANGVVPDETIAKEVYGVIVEVPQHGALDLLAAYSDNSARYWNFTGAGTVWDHPNATLDEPIQYLLKVGQHLVDQGLVIPSTEPRPSYLDPDWFRATMLTAAGLCMVQTDFNVFNADPMGKIVIGAALNLLKAITSLK